MRTLLPPTFTLDLPPASDAAPRRLPTAADWQLADPPPAHAAGTGAAKRLFAGTDEAAVQREAAMILSALDAADEACEPDVARANLNRRRTKRIPYRTRGGLRLFADAPGAVPWTIFTRNVSVASAGFISPDRLPLGYGGTLTLVDPDDGPPLRLDVTLTRCTSCCGGWYYGAMAFNRPVPAFERMAR